jgi:hypothetical protein
MRGRPPDLDEQFDRLERVCPRFLRRLIHVLREPRLRWARTIAGILLIIGSMFWFLPIVGLEMLPIGLMLIALDVPFLRRPVARMIAWGEQLVLQCVALWIRLRAGAVQRQRGDRRMSTLRTSPEQ